MAVPFLDLTRQYELLKDELEPAVLEVMRSGLYIGGRYVTAFEDGMKQYLGVKHAISCANGTDAIILSLRACGITAGDEVITSPFTFFATAEAIAQIGAVPVFADIREGDFNIDPALIEPRVTKQTKAVIPVHIFGNPCDLCAINNVVKKHGLFVVEDAAQAVGSVYNGRRIGASNDLTTFSFYPTKNLGAFGDAGMITTNDDQLAAIVTALKEHGAGANGARARELLYSASDTHVFDTAHSGDSLYNPHKYYNYLIGYNSRLDGIQAAILNIKLKYLDTFNDARRRIAERYTEGLQDICITPACTEGVSGCNHQYAIRTERKHELVAALAAKGIGTGTFYPVPLHLQKAFDYLGYTAGSLPVAERIAGQTVCLPIFPELTDDEVSEVIAGVRDFFKGE